MDKAPDMNPPDKTDPQDNRVHLKLLEMMRGLASIAVVLHHVGAISMNSHNTLFAGSFFNRCHLRLDFFFVLSGFFIAWIHERDLGHPERGKGFLVKRLIRIYPLLFVLTTIKLAAILCSQSLGRWRMGALDLTVVVQSYLMLPQDHKHHPLILAAWTMPYEVMFYLVFATAIAFGTRWLALLATFWASAIVIMHTRTGGDMDFPLSFLLRPYHLQLLGGAALGILIRRWRGERWALPLMAAGLTLMVIGLYHWEFIEAASQLHRRSWWLFVFALLIAGAALYERARKTPLQAPGVLLFLGRASYSTYLVHSPVLVIGLGWMAGHGLLNSSGHQYCLWGLAFIAISLGLLCHVVLEKPLNTWIKRRFLKR